MHHPTRIMALADGIFAIAMTLLVLDLRVPAADLHGDDPGTHPFDVLAIRVYACHMILCGALMLTLYRSAFIRDRLAIRAVTRAARRAATGCILLGPAGYLIAIALSFASVPLSLCIIGLVALLYLLPTKVDQHYAATPSNPDPKS
jgi:uncharacterized membrane protein